jgi:D-sedoheptulose 7-phosphate isomerase
MLVQRIQQQFIDSADLGYQCAEALGLAVDAAIGAVQAVVTGGGKVWVHGVGTGTWLAPLFVSQFVGTFDRERPALPAVLLPTDSPVRALSALGTADDLLLLIGARGADGVEAQLALVVAAHERDMTVVALSALGNGLLAHRLRDTDVNVCVPHADAARIAEMHLLVLNCVCDGVDALLLGDAALKETFA